MVDSEEQEYLDGESLTALDFDQRYMIDSISARDGTVVVTLKINDRVNDITWIGRKL